MSAPIDKMDEHALRRHALHQRVELAKMKAKNERQRAFINRLIAANDDCVFRIEAELLREEVAEKNMEINTLATEINRLTNEVAEAEATNMPANVR